MLAALTVLTLICSSGGSANDSSQPSAPESRIRIQPQSSDTRLEDIAESIDGTRLITHDRSYSPRLWDAKRQILLRVLSGHPDPVFSVTFSPDGKLIETLSQRELRIWDSVRAKQIAVVSAPNAVKFSAAVFSSDSKSIAVGQEDGRIWTAPARKPVVVPGTSVGSKGIFDIEFSGDGSLLGITSASGAYVVGVTTHKVVNLAGKSPKNLPYWGRFSPDGKLFLVTWNDGKARLNDSKTGAITQSFEHVVGEKGFMMNTLMAALWVGKGRREILACASDGTMKIFDPGADKPKRLLKGHTKAVREIRESHDGRYIATYGTDEQLKLWDAVAGKEKPFVSEGGNPTAGEFNDKGDTWLLGYDDGVIRRFDLNTGRAVKTRLCEVETTYEAMVLGDSKRLYLRGVFDRSFSRQRSTRQFFLELNGSNTPYIVNMDWDGRRFSSNGRYAYVNSRVGNLKTAVFDLERREMLGYFDQMFFESAFYPDATGLIVGGAEGTLYNYSLSPLKSINAWDLHVKDTIDGLDIHPSQPWVAGCLPDGSTVIVLNYTTGERIALIKTKESAKDCYFVDGGEKLLVSSTTGSIECFEVRTGKALWTYIPTVKDRHYGFDGPVFTADRSRLAIISQQDVTILNAASGQKIWTHTYASDSQPKSIEAAFGAKGHLFAIADGAACTIFNVDSGAQELVLSTAATITSVAFGIGDTRLLASDGADGVTIWDSDPATSSTGATAKPARARKCGSIVMMKDGSWLAYDDQGRYDAQDPDDVRGAYFVLEWAGGLEPISMPQLKSQFYEPNLLSKMLGVSTEPLRDVPDVSALRLFPQIKLEHDAKDKDKVNVSLTERDGGGIGRIEVSVNGKVVLRKDSVGYFALDLKDFDRYLLPSTLLPKGTGNRLSVTATNLDEDLKSDQVALDLGVPAALKVPEVRLFALCAGVSDYAGEAGDLEAPARDAASLAAAIRQVAERLLPGRVSVDVLTTDQKEPSQRPTRAAILKWLESTAKKASSSDIVLIFFAGHGVSEIGKQHGYFFLTSEADPGNVNPAMAGTATISAEDLRSGLSKISANKQIVILDTCHSGAAAQDLLAAKRSISGDYQRAWESIKDTTGTWMLAGAAADQKSYESSSVEHGILTYSLLEAIDKATPDGLRSASGTELFVDVERWLSYAAARVESLKNDVGVSGIQRPELKRAKSSASFDLGIVDPSKKGSLGLKPPRPIVIVGTFQKDEEDPLGLEKAVAESMRAASGFKAWFDVAKHPGVYRVAGTYELAGDTVTVKVFFQQFDAAQNRKTLDTFTVEGKKSDLAGLAKLIRDGIEKRVGDLSSG